MPWCSQGGGGGGGGQGPWGRGPGGQQPPDLEELLRKGQDRIRRFLPGGVGGVGGLVLIIAQPSYGRGRGGDASDTQRVPSGY